MVKVITYGTYDLLHYGHIRLLERAKALGDYLVVGVTADDFDKIRGKINVKQTLSERIEAVRALGIADEVIVEEYEGQKIDDIHRYGIDIFTVGSDWEGSFDYLKEFCKVVYLPRTEGVSSSDIRQQKRKLNLGIVGSSTFLNKIAESADSVNGIVLSGICTDNIEKMSDKIRALPVITDSYEELLECSDAVYIHSHPRNHYELTKTALLRGKHVLCESPVALEREQCSELFQMAEEKGCVLVDGLKTAYAIAFHRLLLLVKSGKIGKVVSVDATCTSLKNLANITEEGRARVWNSITAWGPTALLPVFQILGTKYEKMFLASHYIDAERNFDTFSKVSFLYSDAVASIKVGNGMKSEGELIISGTKGYIYVPAPWWKTEYFEIRYENPADNKRYFYQLENEGISFELASFAKMVETGNKDYYIHREDSLAICEVMEEFERKVNVMQLA